MQQEAQAHQQGKAKPSDDDIVASAAVANADLDRLAALLGGPSGDAVAKTAAAAGQKTKGSSQGSTILFLFGVVGSILGLSYCVHRLGGPGSIEARLDRTFYRLTGRRLPGAVINSRGEYAALGGGGGGGAGSRGRRGNSMLPR